MTPAQLPKIINARPFRPFVMRTADEDGARSRSRTRRISLMEAVGSRSLVVRDDVEIIDLLLVPSLKTTAEGSQ